MGDDRAGAATQAERVVLVTGADRRGVEQGATTTRERIETDPEVAGLRDDDAIAKLACPATGTPRPRRRHEVCSAAMIAARVGQRLPTLSFDRKRRRSEIIERDCGLGAAVD